MRKPGVEAGILKTPPGVNIKEHASDSTLKLNSETINDILRGLFGEFHILF